MLLGYIKSILEVKLIKIKERDKKTVNHIVVDGLSKGQFSCRSNLLTQFL
jgi:hypothetical protein